MGIVDFLTERAYAEHKKYCNDLKLRYSVLKKSEGRLSGLSLSEIAHKREIKREIRTEAIRLHSEIAAHEIYFSSFSSVGTCSRLVKRCYGSEASFLYEIFKASRDFGEGFCFIGKRGEDIYFKCVKTPSDILLFSEPTLAVDLFEHAYFRDFGHGREDYLNSALQRLNLSVFDAPVSRSKREI